MSVLSKDLANPHSSNRGVISAQPQTVASVYQDQLDAVKGSERSIDAHAAALIKWPDGEEKSLDEITNLPDLEGAFSFDWWEGTALSTATLSASTTSLKEEDAAAKAILGALITQGMVPQRDAGGAGRAYGVSLQLKTDISLADPVAKLSFASSNGMMPHLTITGGDGQGHRVATEIQNARLAWKLSRVDVKIDISLEGGWDALFAKAEVYASANKKVKSPQTIVGSEGGRTFMLGAASSRARIRVYEKDKERYAKRKISEEDVDPNLIRVEMQFRPKKLDAVAMAHMTPWEIARTSAMTRSFLAILAEVLGVGGTIVPTKKQPATSPRTEFDAEESGFMQYQRTFARAACALKFHEIADAIAREEDCCPQIAASDIEELMVERFRSYVVTSSIAPSVLADYGFQEGVPFDPEERAEKIMKLAYELSMKRTRDRLVALAQALDLFADVGLSEELLASVSEKIESLSEKEEGVLNLEDPDDLETLKTVWGHQYPPEIYLQGLRYYLACRGFLSAPPIVEEEYEAAQELENSYREPDVPASSSKHQSSQKP